MDMYSAAFAAMAAFMVLIVACLVILIPFYVLRSLGLYRIAINRGMANPWIAWIPIVNNYIIGQCVGTVQIGTLTVTNTGLILGAGPFVLMAASALTVIPILGGFIIFVCSIAFSIFMLYCYYKFCQQYAPDNAVLYLILSIFFSGMADAIIIFTFRNKYPVFYGTTPPPNNYNNQYRP